MKNILLTAAAVLCAGILSAGDFILKSGTPVQIILPDKLPHNAMYRSVEPGAKRLAAALKYAFGVNVPVLRESKAKPGVKTISLGMTQKAVKRGLKPASGFNYVIDADDNTLYIAGYDMPRTKKVYNAWRPAQEEFYLGTLRGIVEFMETKMNARFLWPGENGADYAKLKELRVPAKLIRSQEPLLSFAEGGYPTYLDTVYDYALGWYGRGGWQMYGGHSIRNIAGRIPFKTHPECYALLSGIRVCGGNMHFCLSNPLVLETYHKVVGEMFDAGVDAYEIGVDDSYQGCQCKECAKIHPSVSERVWIFYRKLAEKFAKTHPKKNLVLISYDQTLNPPVSFDSFPGNVYIELCHYSQKDFDTWKKVKGIKGFSVYTYTWGYYQILGMTPKGTPETVVRLAKLFAKNNVKGFYRCGFGENYGLDGVLYYMQGKLLKNPDLDPKKLENEFYDRAFHEAAPVMRNFFKKLHDQLAYYPRLMGEGGAKDYWTKRVLGKDARETVQIIWNSTLLKTMERDLKAAERIAKDPKVKKRLELVRLEFDYAKHLSHSLRAYSAYLDQPDQAGFDKVEKAVKARRKFLDALCDKKGNIKRFPGWPELIPFSGSPMPGFGAKRETLEVNGRLAAPIAGPLVWDFENYRKMKVLPDASRKSIIAKFTPKFPHISHADPNWRSVPWGKIGQLGNPKCPAGGWFKVLYDKNNLYVFVQSSVPANRTYKAVGRNYAACHDDCAEVYIDPEGVGNKYYHFVANPIENSFMDGAFGLITDPIDLRYQTYDVKWDGQWKYYTRRVWPVKTQPWHCWWAMFVIPFKTLGTTMPAKGTIWSMDCARVVFSTPGNWRDVKLYLWSAPEGKFHDRFNFGELVFN